MIITIDGPAGSGKSTVAKIIARKLSMNQIDSGALYRTYTHIALTYAGESGKEIAEAIESSEFKKYLSEQKIIIKFISGKQEVIWNDRDMESCIRLPAITRNIKLVADTRFIREAVNEQISKISQQYSIVADGRDMGTVVFPSAEFKFFLTASLDVRATRRLEEFQRQNPEITLDQVKQEIDKRDRDDQEREFGQLRPAPDAIFVDTSNLDLNAVVNLVVDIIQKKQPV